MKSALTIAGSDTSGGAGIQADIKSMMANGVFAQSVITALTAQNTMGVTGVMGISAPFVEEQIDAVFADIRPDAVKIGMISDPAVARAIAGRLVAHRADHVVLDPVMVATSGAALSSDQSVLAVVNELFPCAELVTPNLEEAQVLVRIAHERSASCPAMEVIATEQDMVTAARSIATLGTKAVLVKGGHLTGEALDILLLEDGQVVRLTSHRVDTTSTHGTGCTLSSAIAANLAKGMELSLAVAAAKEYLTATLEHDPHLGHGRGPMNHGWKLS